MQTFKRLPGRAHYVCGQRHDSGHTRWNGSAVCVNQRFKTLRIPLWRIDSAPHGGARRSGPILSVHSSQKWLITWSNCRTLLCSVVSGLLAIKDNPSTNNWPETAVHTSWLIQTWGFTFDDNFDDKSYKSYLISVRILPIFSRTPPVSCVHELPGKSVLWTWCGLTQRVYYMLKTMNN